MTGVDRATAADADEIGRFQTRCWEQTYRGIVPDEFLDAAGDDGAARTRAARWAGRITSGARTVMTTRSADGTLVGVASAARASAPADGLPALELCTLYVDQDAQGTGVADALLAATVGDEDAHLLVFTSNERARRFYRRHGFAPEGEPAVDPGTGLDEERWVRRSGGR